MSWVDFKTVKAAVSISQVLEHYQIQLRSISADALRGHCPLQAEGGQNSFHVSLSKGAFQCFSCQAKGNVLDLVAALEHCSVREAALKLAQWFSLPESKPRPDASPTPAHPSKPAASPPEAEQLVAPKQPAGFPAPTQSNEPLKFQLKGVDPLHPYLAERRIQPETARLFGVGFFPGRGSMAGRLVIPIHNEQGQLVAYAGRALDNTPPKYKLPSGFHKSLVLFNLNRVLEQNPRPRQVVVVEGFFDCFKVQEAGFPCVALMGNSLSAPQEELMRRYFKAVCLMLDGDEAGQQATWQLVPTLAPHLWVRVALVPKGKQPDQLSPAQIQALLGSLVL